MTKFEVMIRNATVNDLDALIELETKGFKLDRFDKKQYRYLITKARSNVTVAEISGRIVGASIMIWKKNSRSGRLYNIVVDPESHGSGIGSRLLGRCETETRKNGFDAVTLEVRIDNEKAIAFYLKHGYQRVRKVPRYYSDGMAALKMKKTLEPAG